MIVLLNNSKEFIVAWNDSMDTTLILG